MTEKEWCTIFKNLHSSKLTNKVKEFIFKIFHGYVATNNLLYKMNIIDTPRCTLCNLYNQTTSHLFIECIEVKNFWFRLQDFLKEKYNKEYILKPNDILFGLPNKTDNYRDINEYINASKYFIYYTAKDYKKLNLLL